MIDKFYPNGVLEDYQIGEESMNAGQDNRE